MTAPDSGLSAALLQVTGQAERIALLENRVAENLRHTDVTLAGMSAAITDLKKAVDDQAELLRSLLPPHDDEPARGYTPRPSVHWWTISGEERLKAVTRLGAFVEQVYRPYYGHLAAMLGACWAEHPLCLVQLDWLSELHSVLHFQPKRSASLLVSQAEFGTRIVPAVSEQFRVETSRCPHRQASAAGNGSPWAGAR
jgi:uncharacterized coiled-coil protein SlyX